jgi:hypothetical protein
MLGIDEVRQATWRREGAATAYAGYVAVTADAVRLQGSGAATGIDVALRIPHAAIERVRVEGDAVVLELSDGAPLRVVPAGRGAAALAGRLVRASRPTGARAPARSARAQRGSRGAASA